MTRITTGSLIFALAVLLLTPAARAQDVFSTEGSIAPGFHLTPPSTIALTFFKLGGAEPDYNSWARETPAFKSAAPFEQAAVIERETAMMKAAYSQLATRDPISVETTATLSAYDPQNKGFFILNFRSATFFPAHYIDRSFALVPQGLVDKQWMKVEDPAVAEAVEKAARASKGRSLPLVIEVIAQYADTKTPASIGGEAWWPLVVKVHRMMIYDAEKKTLLWQSDENGEGSTARKSILNLYK